MGMRGRGRDGASGRVSIRGNRVEGGSSLAIALLDKLGKRKKLQKRVAWADEVGGELLQVFKGLDDAEVTVAASSKGAPRDQKNPINGYQPKGTPRHALVAEATVADSSKDVHRDQKYSLNGYQPKGTPRLASLGPTRGGGSRREGDGVSCPLLGSRSYKEALMRGEQAHSTEPTHRFPPQLSSSFLQGPLYLSGPLLHPGSEEVLPVPWQGPHRRGLS